MALLFFSVVYVLSIITINASQIKSVLLFIDHERLSWHRNLAIKAGKPRLLSKWRDPSSFIGWGYPSVWRTESGLWKMLYQGWHIPTQNVGNSSTVKLMLMAISDDAIHWRAAKVPGNPCRTQGIADAPNCVAVSGLDEFSFVFDDQMYVAAEDSKERLKLLWANGSISISNDQGHSWHSNWANWTSEGVDPGISIFRNPLRSSELVVTSRPQNLRETSGRHAGYHSGMSWKDLGSKTNRRALPVDTLYSSTKQIYGLPSFCYGNVVVSWLWIYNCTSSIVHGKCYLGGVVSSGIAISYDSRNFSAAVEKSFSNKVEPAMIFKNIENGPSAGQVYPNTLIVQASNEKSQFKKSVILIHASASTHPHGYVSTSPGTWSSILTYMLRLDGFACATVKRVEDGSAYFETQPFLWESGELSINANCSEFGDKIKIMIKNGTSRELLSGFHSIFKGDATDAVVRWKLGKKLQSLSGEVLMLTAKLVGSAQLYSFRGHFQWTL